MREIAAAIVPLATIVFAVSSMLAVGLGNTAATILDPLRHWPRVIRAVAANFMLAPALAYLLVRLLRLEMPLALGLVIVGSAAGAPFLLKLTQAARSDVAFAASLLVLLLPLTVLYLPLTLPVILPDADVSAAAIARPLVFSMLLPLAAGLLLRPYAPRFAARMQPLLGRLSTYALVAIVVSVVIANWQALLSVGGKAVFAAVAFIVGTLALGWSLGGLVRTNREVVALGTAQRNIGAATVVATQTFENLPGVIVMVTTTMVVGMLLLFPVAFAMRKREDRTAHAGLLRRRHA